MTLVDLTKKNVLDIIAHSKELEVNRFGNYHFTTSENLFFVNGDIVEKKRNDETNMRLKMKKTSIRYEKSVDIIGKKEWLKIASDYIKNIKGIEDNGVITHLAFIFNKDKNIYILVKI